VPETAPDGRPLTRPLYVVLLLSAVLLINYVDRGALGTAGPLIQHDLHLTNGQYGLLFSAFFWIYAIIQIPVGALAERYGPRASWCGRRRPRSPASPRASRC
jgi:MFS family permease